MPGGSIDAIKVALGADLKQLRNDLQNAKRDLEKALPEKRTVHVSVNVTTPNHAVSELYQNIQNQFAAFQKGAGHQALRIAPRLMADPRMMVMFRREVDRNMAIAGRSGQGIHVPVRFNGDVKAFVASIGKIEVPVYGRWAGYAPGGTPPTTNDGGPAGGQGPSGSSPTRPKKPSPPSVDERVNARAEAVAQRTQAGPVVAPIPTGRPKPSQRAKGATPVVARGGIEERSSDRYEAPEEPVGRQPYATPGFSAPVGSRPAPVSRRAKAQGATPPQPSAVPGKRTTYGPGNRDTIGASINPAYVEPEGGRVTVGNVRSGATIEELPRGSQERADYESQQRARPTRAQDQVEQSGERKTPVIHNKLIRRHLDWLAGEQRRRDEPKRKASPEDTAARGHIATNFSSLDPDLGQLYKMINDPAYTGTYEEFIDAAASGRTAYGTAFHGMDKRTRRQRGVARGYKKGSIEAVPPDLLLKDAALDAARQFAQTQMDPLFTVRSGDQKGRGPGGKVGKSGGRTVGRLSSETIEPGIVDEILTRRAGGVSWKQIDTTYGKQATKRAKARLKTRDAVPPTVTPIVPGQAYGGFMEDATPVQGGQGMSRKSNATIAQETSAARRREAERRERLGAVDIDTPTHTPAPKLRDEIRAPAEPPPAPSFSGAGRTRSSRPPRPESRAYGRNTGYTPGGGFAGGGFGGSAGFYEFLKGFRATAPGQAPTFAGKYPERVQKLIAMAGQTEQSPNEASIARQLLRRRGIPGFAEGGVLHFREGGTVPGRQLRSLIGQGASLPRIGSIPRQALEDKYLKGVRAKQQRQAKPTYQQGGNSDRRFRALANAQFEKDPFCAYCGRETFRGGGRAPNSFEADHKLDAGRGGAIYDPDNIISSCKSCNSYKSGGKSARLLMPGQRVKSLPSGGESPAAQAKRALDYDSERHYHDGYAEGGMWGWGKKKMRGYAEGGGFGKLPAGLQGSARRNFGALTAEYGIPVNLKSGHGQGVHATPARSVVIGRDSQPGEKGEWPYTFAHEYGHLIDDSIPFRQRNKFMRGALGRLGHAEEFADMFAQAHRSGEDPFSIKDFIKASGRVRGGVLGRSLNRMGQDFSLRFARRAEGGYVKHGGLLDRLAQAGHEPSVTMVGERGPELLVSDKNTGQTEVVPTHKVPMWLQRAQEGKGFGKALDHHAEGGTWRMRGPAGPRAATPMRMNSGTLGGGDITRVFVVNWPASAGQGQFAAAQGHPAQAEARSPGSTQGKARQSPPPSPEDQAGQAPPRNERTDPGTTTGAPLPGRAQNATGNFGARFEARRGARSDVSGFEERIQNVREGIQTNLQEAPVRALSVAFGQIAQSMIGGRSGILRRASEARGAAGTANEEVGELKRLSELRRKFEIEISDIDKGVSDVAPENQRATRADRERQLANIGPVIEKQRGVAEGATAEAERIQGTILTRPQQFKAQAVGLGGIIAGTALFSTAIGAFSTATAAAAAVLDPLVQTMLGWPAAIDKVTSSIRDNITAAGGNVRAGTAAAVAPSGISAAYLDSQGQNLTATGAYRAASAAGEQARDITRAAARKSPSGLYEGVGGLFGSNIGTELFGGQAGALQQVTGRISATQQPRDFGTNIGDATIGGGLTYLLDKYAKTDVSGSSVYGDGADTQAVVEDLNKSLKSAATYAGDVGSAFQLLTKATGATEAQQEAMVQSASRISKEAEARALELRQAGIAVVGPNGQNLQGKEFGQYSDQQVRGGLIQDPALLLRASEPQRKARAFAMAAQADFARNEDIPAQAALQTAAQPLARFGTTFGTAGADQKTLDSIASYTRASAAADASIAKTTAQGTAAQEKIVSRIDNPTFEGGPAPRTAADLGLGGPKVTGGGPGPALTNFRGIVGEIGSLGSQINTITEGINLRQVNLQAHEYAEQIRITERSLADSQDLWAGINGATSKTLGGLQGQNVLLDRQNQLLGRRAQRLSFKSEDIGFKSSDLQIQAQNLGFQQSQRQINFSKAVAGFAAPGETPEEIAARVNEAKIEADLAQKQLDLQIQIAEQGREQLKIAKEQAGINREQFGNQTKQQDNTYAITREEAKRAVTDIRAQLDLLKESRSITIDSAAAEATIERLRKAQGVLVEEAGAYLTQGQEVRSAVLSDIESLMAATGKGFGELVTEVTGAWAAAFKAAYSNFLLPVSNYLNQMGRSGTSGNSHGGSGAGAGVFAASGYSGSVSTPTQFVAGEAGTEHVLVIKSPKTGTLDMGAGMGGGTTINVGGISIVVQGGKEMDEEKLAVAVERRITRKLALISG